MHKFRSTWLALIGGAFLVTLSISAAFGADPADETSNRGQTIAGFVHDLVLGDNAPTDDEVDQDEDTDEVDEDGDEADERTPMRRTRPMRTPKRPTRTPTRRTRPMSPAPSTASASQRLPTRRPPARTRLSPTLRTTASGSARMLATSAGA